MEMDFEHNLEDLEDVKAPLDEDMTQTTSDGCSSKNKDVVLSLDDTSAHDSPLSYPSTVSKCGKHSSYKGTYFFPSSKHKIIKRVFSSMKTKDATFNEDCEILVKMEVMNDSKETRTKGIVEAINKTSQTEMKLTMTPIIATLTLDSMFAETPLANSSHVDTNPGIPTAPSQNFKEIPQQNVVSEDSQDSKDYDNVLEFLKKAKNRANIGMELDN